MNGPFLVGSPGYAGSERRRSGGSQRGIATIAAVLLCLALLAPAAPVFSAGGSGTDTRSFTQRAEAERSSRSRFRRLEVASLVLILVCGGAVVLWAIRRK